MVVVVDLVVAVVRSMTLAVYLLVGVVMDIVGCLGLAVREDVRPGVVVSQPLTAAVVVLTSMAPAFAVSVRIVIGSGGSSPSIWGVRGRVGVRGSGSHDPSISATRYRPSTMGGGEETCPRGATRENERKNINASTMATRMTAVRTRLRRRDHLGGRIGRRIPAHVSQRRPAAVCVRQSWQYGVRHRPQRRRVGRPA